MSQSNICVGIRARPLLDHQKERRAPGLEIRGNRILTGTKVFDPDVVFNEDASQSSIVDSCVPVFESVASGRNGTIMVYGQTGTGKTHTMFGGLHDSAFSSPATAIATNSTPINTGGNPSSSSTMPAPASLSQPTAPSSALLCPSTPSSGSHNSGIVYSALEYLLERVRSKTRNGLAASISVSMIEIYNEKITDMLPLSIDVPRRGGAAGGSNNSNNNNASSQRRQQDSPLPCPTPYVDSDEACDNEVDENFTTIGEDEEEECETRSVVSLAATTASSTSDVDTFSSRTKTAKPSLISAGGVTKPTAGKPSHSSSTAASSHNFKEGGVLLVNGTPRNNRSIVVTSVEDAVYVVRKALARRHVSPTAMNERSSRSHVIVMLTLDERLTVDSTPETSHLYLIDLAGSECLKKSLATGKAAAEAGMINKSLHALRNVITALTSSQAQQAGGGASAASAAAAAAGGSTFGAPPSGRVHVPYRDSKLTELLQDSVGGTAKTMLIACISLVARDLEETKMTLEYATKARKIKNSPTADERDKFLLRIRSLEYQLQQALNKTPGSVTISREFYEEMLQLNARLEESNENAEKLSHMLSHAEASQRIEKYQQEENARAIRAAEDERTRCVSYLLQQVAQVDDIKSRLAASYASMHHTMEEAQCDWYVTADNILRRAENTTDNISSVEDLISTCPSGVGQLESVVRRVQTSVDELVSDMIERTKLHESCVREMATDRSRDVMEDLRSTNQKLQEIAAQLTRTQEKVGRWHAESGSLASSHTQWVETVQQRDPVVTPSLFVTPLSTVKRETLRDVRSMLQLNGEQQQQQQPQQNGSVMLRQSLAAQRGSVAQVRSSANTPSNAATKQLGSTSATSAFAETEPSSPLLFSASSSSAPSIDVGATSALTKVKSLFKQSASLLTAWKHETLAGAPSSSAEGLIATVPLSQQQRVVLTQPPSAPALSHHVSTALTTEPATTLNSSYLPSSSSAKSTSTSAGFIPATTTSLSSAAKSLPSGTRPTGTAANSVLPPSVLRPSALRNSYSTTASGGGSAMANAAAAAAARKRPRSLSSSSLPAAGAVMTSPVTLRRPTNNTTAPPSTPPQSQFE